MIDETESARREIIATTTPLSDREKVEAKYGEVWNTEELSRDFEVLGFLAPFVGVRRKSDGVKGSLQFQAHPRYYHSFQPE